MSKIAANGSAATYLRMRDMRQGVGKQRAIMQELAVPFHGAIACERSHAEVLRVRPVETGKLSQAVDIDQHGGACQAEIHRGYQALAASQESCLIAILGFEGQSLVERGYGNVFEWSRFHFAPDDPPICARLASATAQIIRRQAYKSKSCKASYGRTKRQLSQRLEK